VLDQARSADYAIWAVALLLYVCDAAKLLAPRDLLLVESGGGRFAASFSENPFTLAGRVLAFAPLLRPHRAVFVAAWARPWTDGARLRRTLASVDRLRAALPVVRILAAWAFALLFVVGPGLTLALGPSAAILYTAAVLYPTVAVAIVVLWVRRRPLQLTVARCASLSVEILVCPAFLPNLVRKITAPQPIEADAAQIVVASASSDVKAEFLRRLESRTEELIEEASPDQAAQEALRSYLATVRGAR
jgi:hypothetical protein